MIQPSWESAREDTVDYSRSNGTNPMPMECARQAFREEQGHYNILRIGLPW